MILRLFLTLSLTLLDTNVGAQAIMDTEYGQNVDPSNLSDQDKDLSENFVHNEKVQRIYEEECTASSENEDACLGNKADPKFMGMKSSMVGALAKAYSMIMGTAGGELGTEKYEWAKTDEEKTKELADSKDPDATTKKEKEQKDYCKYIPVATEAIAMLNTTTDQQSITNLPTKESSQQKDSLLKAAANHDSRAKTAKIQATGWGAGTACYVASIAAGDAVFANTGNILKLASSALLTKFYSDQIKAHEEYANKTKAIADKLPGSGDCNPITDKLCFCTEETSKTRPDYQQYCQPHLTDRNMLVTSERVTCVDENLKDDPSCVCAVRDTCVDKKVMTTITGLNGQGFLSSPSMADFSSLAKGELTSRSLSSTQSNLNNAIAELKKLDKKVKLEPNIILTKAQQNEMKLLEDMGLPPNLAQKVATTPLSAEAKKNVAKFKGNYSPSRRNYSNSNRKKRGSVLTFSGGDGINSQKKKVVNKRPDFLSRFNKKKKSKSNNQTVLKFAQQAEQRAQISKNSDRKIFDIISRRYQVSGWRRLEYIK